MRTCCNEQGCRQRNCTLPSFFHIWTLHLLFLRHFLRQNYSFAEFLIQKVRTFCVCSALIIYDMKDANDAEGRARKALAAGGRVAQVLRQFEAQTETQPQASPSPPARPLRSTPQAPAATASRQSAGRKRKTTQQPAAPAAQPAVVGST